MIRTVIFFLSILLFSCSTIIIKEKKIIKIKGSDTMLFLNLKLAESFMIEHPDISVRVEGGGSGTGINALLNSEIDICASSRPLTPEEIQLFAKEFNTVGMSFLIAKDALSIFVNEKNPVRNISLNKLSKVFLGEITNWKELGGEDAEIIVVSRPPTSGTYGYFKRFILLDQEYSKNAVIIPTTEKIVDFIKNNPNAIGYGGVGYGNEEIEIMVNNIKPIENSMFQDSYPITRYLRYYAPNKVSGIIKQFIDWVISREGQKVIEVAGYFPLLR